MVLVLGPENTCRSLFLTSALCVRNSHHQAWHTLLPPKLLNAMFYLLSLLWESTRVFMCVQTPTMFTY